MTIYPACSGFEEDAGANFTPPTLGNFFKSGQVETKRLLEARAGALVAREGKRFHEKQARKHGINTNRGLAHFRASKMYTREGNRLQEMFEKGGEIGELPPKAIIKANKAAMLFHKKSAEKAGLDSDVGHAHVAAMEHHADIMGRAKKQHEAQFGHSGKQSPVPVPKKSEQPSQDVRQNKPPVQLNPQAANKDPRRLQQKESPRSKKEAGKRGPDYGLGRTFPKKPPQDQLDKKELVYRGKKQKMFDPRIRNREGVHVSPKDQDPTPKEGYVDPRYSSLKKESRSKRSMESRRGSDSEIQPRIDLREFYKQPEAGNGWKNSSVYVPPRNKPTETQNSGLVVREF